MDASPSESSSRTLIPNPAAVSLRSHPQGDHWGANRPFNWIGLGSCFIQVVAAAEFRAVVVAVDFAAAGLPVAVERAEGQVAAVAVLRAALLAEPQAFLREVER